MKPRRARYDSYGQVLPDLATVPRQSLVHSEHNMAMRRYVLELLERQYEDLLQRGVHAEVHIMLQVHNGMLGQKVVIQPRFEHLYEPEDPAP
jgi:hypothetical protein